MTAASLAVRRAVWPLLAGLALVGVLFVGVFPTRTWLSQREELADTAERVRVLGEQNQALEERVKVLGTDEEIERLAREQYNLVRPGEEAYALLPPAPAPEGEGEAGAGEGDWTQRIVASAAYIRGQDPLDPG